MRALLIFTLAVTTAAAQPRDFLTADEVDQVRLAQEPNLRLKLYLGFAKERVALIEQLAAKEKAGRSALIHDTLDGYTKIIEAIDTVSDDALRRNLDITEGMDAVAGAERDFAARLRKVEESAPADLQRYAFVLTNAIEATEDSLEMAQEDMKERKAGVAKRRAEEDKEREELMTPTDRTARQAAQKKKAEEETKTKRKAPTLRRKGEVPAEKP
ncbi:MAG: hypothetical protein IT164_18325 [Bryobacterales bacterium]|nr:hypothetical protein [Bryobacterales bacterium]